MDYAIIALNIGRRENMEFYCEKKKKFIPRKRAKRKCIKVNLEKRKSICNSLKTILTSYELYQYNASSSVSLW
jgi:hypothetical protein